MAEGILDKITKKAGQNFDAFMNGLISKIDGALTAGVGYLGGEGTGAVAEGRNRGGFLSSFREAITGGFEREAEPAIEAPKLGRGARDQALLAAMEAKPATAYDAHEIIRPEVMNNKQPQVAAGIMQ